MWQAFFTREKITGNRQNNQRKTFFYLLFSSHFQKRRTSARWYKQARKAKERNAKWLLFSRCSKNYSEITSPRDSIHPQSPANDVSIAFVLWILYGCCQGFYSLTQRGSPKNRVQKENHISNVREYLSAKVINRITCHLKTQTSLSYEIKFCETLNVAWI